MTSTSSERGVNTLSRWHLEEHGLGEERDGRPHRRIEALQVSGLSDAAMPPGEFDQLVGFGDRGGERLLNQDINAALDQFAGDAEMADSGNRD